MKTNNNSTITRTLNGLEIAYAQLNKKFFKGQLMNDITITLMPDLTKGSLGWATTQKVWHNEEGTDSYEINICADHMNSSIEYIVGVLLHEMVHIYNAENGVKDTTRKGYYHNKNFRDEAVKHGLLVNDESDENFKKYGYYNTTLGDNAKQWIIENIKPIYSMNRDAWKVIKAAKAKKKSPYIKYVCPVCGAMVRSTKEVNLICGDCSEKMEREEVE